MTRRRALVARRQFVLRIALFLGDTGKSARTTEAAPPLFTPATWQPAVAPTLGAQHGLFMPSSFSA